jgi:hypothetical protein
VARGWHRLNLRAWIDKVGVQSSVTKFLGCTYSSNLLVFSQNVNHILS